MNAVSARVLIAKIEVTAPEDYACRDVIGMESETGTEQLEGTSHIAVFPMNLGQRGKG